MPNLIEVTCFRIGVSGNRVAGRPATSPEREPMKMDKLRERLRQDRPMTTISLRISEDVVDELKQIAPLLGFSGHQSLIRAYVGQGLRQDLEQLSSPGQEQRRLAALDRIRGLALGYDRRRVAQPGRSPRKVSLADWVRFLRALVSLNSYPRTISAVRVNST